jgi:type VI secretion system protein
MGQYCGIRLWARLKSNTPDGVFEDLNDSQRIIDSVRDHLSWVLNSRRGDAPSCGDYGLPDLSAIIAGLPKSENEFCAEIEKCIREYEPRISRVRILLFSEETHSNLKVHFFIEVVLKLLPEHGKQRIFGNVDLDTVFILN